VLAIAILYIMKHLLAEACQAWSEDAYDGHLVLRLIAGLSLFYTSRFIFKGQLTMEEMVFTLTHDWMTMDSESFELYAIAIHALKGWHGAAPVDVSASHRQAFTLAARLQIRVLQHRVDELRAIALVRALRRVFVRIVGVETVRALQPVPAAIATFGNDVDLFPTVLSHIRGDEAELPALGGRLTRRQSQ
jgi:hypothetical protein